MIAEPARALAIFSLCDLLRAGLTPRAAVVVWWREVPDAAREPLRRVARRLALGDVPSAALRALRPWFGRDAARLGMLFDLHARSGGDLAAMLQGLAASIERRSAATRAARAACAGATLSGRVVAALPLVFVPLLPASRAPLFDPMGAAMLLAGSLLAVVGMRWMGRLVPRPPDDDPVAELAEHLAAILRGGVELGTALDSASAIGGPLAVEMGRAARRVALGASWPDALERAGRPDLSRLAHTLNLAHGFGLPIATALEELAGAMLAEGERALETSLKRAPVLMVIPLVVCVLPSFVILGLGPFLRGLSLSP